MIIRTHPTELIDRGWYLLPVRPNDKDPYTKFARRGFYSASNDKEQINQWLKVKPDLNWGIACEMSGLIVLDFDYRSMDSQADEFHHLCDQIYYHQTKVVSTGDGLHYYFKAPKELRVAGKIFNGVDIKYRGYVVAEGSIHANGKTYMSLSKEEPMELPQQLLERIER